MDLIIVRSYEMDIRMGEAQKAGQINCWQISGTLLDDVTLRVASTGTKMLKSKLMHLPSGKSATPMTVDITVWAGSLSEEEMTAFLAWKAGAEVVVEGELNFRNGRLSIIVRDIDEKRW